MSKFCQSCGMPRSKDPQGGGTEADGSLSPTYCSLCYDQGAFHYTGSDVAEFQRVVTQKIHENGTPKIIAWLMTRGIPRLSRWKA